jgi:AraC-like DNA-binding protein/tetratricopeptide (TPR) repeat protein
MQKANSLDLGFIKRAVSVVVEHLDQEKISGNELAEHLSLSREQTHRKLKQNVSLSTGKFIRFIRLLRACVYLIEGSDTIAEISFKVGFSSPSYFNKCFREELGISPGDLRKEGITRQITNKKIFSFYRMPELNKILRSNGIHLELPEQERITGFRTSKKVLLMTGIPLLLFVMVLSFLPSMERDNRVLANIVENQRIAVIPFSNQTGDPSMEQIGDIASSWISSQIDDLEGIQTVPFFTILEYLPYMGILPNDPQNRPTFREVVGAQYFITGNYYLKDQHLYFDAQLTDAHTQEFIYNLPVVEGPKDSVMQVIEDLRLKIAGLITNLEEVKLGKLHPPNYEAYKYYLSGLNELRVGLYPSNAHRYFEKAVDLEPEFVMANVFLTWGFLPEEVKWGSILKKMEQFQNMTDYETSVYLELYHTYNRNYREALEVTLRILDEYPQDYYFNMEAAHLAKSQFFPELAIQLLSQLHDPLGSDEGLLWHYFKVWNYTESLVMLDGHEEALTYLKSIPAEFHNPAIPVLFLSVHVQMGKSRSEVEALINRFAGDDMTLFAEYFAIAAYEFGLRSETETSRYFAGKAVTLLQSIPGNKAELFDLADALFLSGDLDGARAFLKQQLEKEPECEDLLIFLSQVEAASGNRSEAERIFAKLEERPRITWRRHEYKYHRDYLRARMYAQLGEIDEAVEFIRSALVKGQLYHHWDFDRDIFLKPIFGHPVFQSLVEPRNYEEVTAVP